MKKKSASKRSILRKKLSPKTNNQSYYIDAIRNSDIVICDGPAGSGKTTICVGLACEFLADNTVEKIIVTRPVIESGKGLGYLPGSFDAKIHPYLVPVMEEMGKYLTKATIERLKDNQIIEVCPLEYMRGRNFHNSFIILDEAQNATLEQIKMFITRMGRNSKVVINGDLQQTDLPEYLRGGLQICINRLDKLDGVSIITLTEDDIIRHKLLSKILARLCDG